MTRRPVNLLKVLQSSSSASNGYALALQQDNHVILGRRLSLKVHQTYTKERGA